MNFFVQNLKAFKKCGLLLFVATVVTSQVDLSLSNQVENAIRNPAGLSNSVYFFGFLSLLGSLLFPIFLLLICLYALDEGSPNSIADLKRYLSRNLQMVMIETLRAWGKTLQWSLLLIIPGLIKYVQFTLVPFVTIFSRAYDRGEVDALKMSTQLVRKNLWSILGLVMFFYFLVPIIFASLFDEYRVLWQTPLSSLFLSLIDAYLFLMTTQCFLRVFKKSLTEAS